MVKKTICKPVELIKAGPGSGLRQSCQVLRSQFAKNSHRLLQKGGVYTLYNIHTYKGGGEGDEKWVCGRMDNQYLA